MKRLAALVVVGACARSAAPARPSTTVHAEIEQAERHERARRHDRARAHYQRAIAAARDPGSVAFARREYAESLVTWGEYAEAIAQLEVVVRARPDDPSAWHDLGVLHHHQGDDARATRALERARDLAPRDPRPRIALAALRWKRGDREGAAREYRALRELELPARVRAKVDWALAELARPR